MSLRCKIFGHKWSYYKEDVEHIIPAITNSHMSIPGFTIVIDTEFRICKRCDYKQVRKHYTGRESDWFKSDLSKEELRDKNLKELGI